jgi:hypothetical protein
MKITNPEKIKGWTPPGNPSISPIITDVETSIIDYTFWIRYYGNQYEMIILRDEFDRIGNFPRYRIAFKNAVNQLWETTIYETVMHDMREFYDTFHTMLHRIVQGTFNKHYPTN